jgi:hypothetical protein
LHTATGRRDRTLLAVRDRPQALATDAVRGKIVAHRLSAASTKRDVILAGAALIRMAFNSERVLAVSLEPLCLLVQRRDGLRGEFRRIRFEEDSIAYSNYEILLGSGLRRAIAPVVSAFLAQHAAASASAATPASLPPCMANMTALDIPVPRPVVSLPDMPQV